LKQSGFSIRRIPIAATIAGVLAFLIFLGPLGTWMLTPSDSVAGYETPQGVVTLVVAACSVFLAAARWRGLRDRWYFSLVVTTTAALIAMPIWFIVANDVIGLSGQVDPQSLDPSLNRADSGLEATIVVTTVYALVQVLHLLLAPLFGARYAAVSLRRSAASAGGSALPRPELEPVLEAGETILRNDPVNAFGWIVSAPRLARLFVTNRRLLFLPPGASPRYTFAAWTLGIFMKGHTLRPPLGQSIEIELEKVSKVWDDDPKFPGRVWIKSGDDVFGYELLRERPVGRSRLSEAEQHEHYLVVEGLWLRTRAEGASS
jgi:hypothetical protein